MFLGLCYSSAWFTGAACLFHLIYKFIRKYTCVTVNCWFCNLNSKILFEKRKEWYCTHCQQFNGFNQDGDYSKPIPEQYNENLNPGCVKYSTSYKRSISNANGLCRICNANQELKIKQLALYVPLKEEDYDQEIEAFKQKLEKSYKLCPVCESTVYSTLKLKSNLFQTKILSKPAENINRKSFSPQKTYTKWKYIFLLIFLVLIMTLMWEFHFENFNFGQNINLESYIEILHSFDYLHLNTDYNSTVNIALAISSVFFIKSILRGAKFFGPMFFGTIVFIISDYLTPVLKIIGIFAVFIYFIFKYFKTRKQKRKYLQKLSSKVKNRAEENEDDLYISEELSYYSNNDTTKNPLCGKFSNLNLGLSQTPVANQKKIPYLFKSAKLLIKPSRLKLDDSPPTFSSGYDSVTSSPPTVSSGYDSVTSYFRRSPDSISEFDSISQVGNNFCGMLPTHSKWKSDNILLNCVPTNNDNFRTMFNPQNQISSYCRDKKYYVNSDKFYGVSPLFSPSPSTSISQTHQVQVNTLCSTIQIILCSVACFTLGFFFQILINKVKF